MGNYLAAIWRCRFFWMSLVKNDLRTRYRRSILGMGWSLLHPIAMTVIICLVFHKLLNADVWTFGPYLLGGLACWNYILSSTTIGCQSLFQGESYIRQYPAPLAIYPLRTTLGATIHFLLALVVVFGLMWVVKAHFRHVALEAERLGEQSAQLTEETPHEESSQDPRTVALKKKSSEEQTISGDLALLPLLSLVPTLCLLFIFCWSLAVLAGFSNVFFQDTQHLCEVGFQICFYMTPIMYYKSMLANHGLTWLLYANPLTPMLDLIREPIIYGHFPSWSTYGLAVGMVSIVACAAILALAKLQRRVIFYM